MGQSAFPYQTHVGSNWIDYNGHMTDSAYAKVFSYSIGAFFNRIGLHAEAIEKQSFTTFTLETHIQYVQEANEGEQLNITGRLVDVDDKRLHLFFTMRNNAGDILATCEKMIMGIDPAQRKAASFPADIAANIEQVWQVDKQLEKPEQVGRTIGIKH